MPNKNNFIDKLKKKFKNDYIDGEDQEELTPITFFLYLITTILLACLTFTSWAWYGVIFWISLFLFLIIGLIKHGK